MSKTSNEPKTKRRRPKYRGPREASIHRVGDRMIAMSTMITDIGMPIAGDEVCVLTNPEPVQIGDAVRRVLAEFRVGVPHPYGKDARAAERRFLRAMGFSSLQQFHDAADSRLGAGDDGHLIVLRPSAKDNQHGGFLPFDVEPEFVSRSASAEELGLAVLRAFDKCSTPPR